MLITYSSLHSEVKGKKPYLSNLSTCEASISIKSRCTIIWPQLAIVKTVTKSKINWIIYLHFLTRFFMSVHLLHKFQTRQNISADFLILDFFLIWYWKLNFCLPKFHTSKINSSKHCRRLNSGLLLDPFDFEFLNLTTCSTFVNSNALVTKIQTAKINSSEHCCRFKLCKTFD